MDRLISEQAVLDILAQYEDSEDLAGVLIRIIKELPSIKPQESSRDIEEIKEVINCDTDAETKCKMISNILTAKPHYFKEQEPCEDCISREEAIRIAEQGQIQGYEWQFKKLCTLPSVTPEPYKEESE